jgi:hypothetical protein
MGDWEKAVELSQASYKSVKSICGSIVVQVVGSYRA